MRSSETPVRYSLLLLVATVFALATPAAGQDRFGAAVTVTDGGEVAVLKPGKAIGPAAAVVYRLAADGEWTSEARLSKLPGGYPGEAMIPVLVSGGDLLLLGSADPNGWEAGHLYERSASGWAARTRVPLDPVFAVGRDDLPAGGLDMPTLNRLMGPPSRTIALSPDGSRLAVAGGALPAGTVHVLRRDAGEWDLEGVVRGDDEEGAFGAALAISGDHLLVGAPEEGFGGAAYFFEHTGDEWTRRTVVAADTSESDGKLGAAVTLALPGNEAFVAAPGRDRVVRASLESGGGWVRRQELAPGDSDGSERTAFGTALALHGDRLVIGAPEADNGQGRVHVFARGADGWASGRTLVPGDLENGAFGSAVALRGDFAAVGAPGAWGNSGRAAVFELGSDAGPIWLDPVEELRTVTGAEPVRCADGEAAGFECESVDLVSFLPLSALGAEPGERITDIWGWTDPETGREYVLAGRTAGLAFVDVTEPGAPEFVGLMPANPSGARDIKVYQDYAFMTGDGAGDHGLLVFDLTRLRAGAGESGTFDADARYDLVASAHNLVIDTESGFAYTVGTNTGGQSCGGGLHMIDIRDPLRPEFAGCYTDGEGLIWAGRTHDAQCIVYSGPDDQYHGRQICFAANETAMRIVDVTDKSNPEPISTASHPGTAYVHQGWLTEDQRYLYVNDELDEIVGTTDRTRTLIYDVAELDDPILIGEHLGPDQATDHNLFISGDRAYLANYQAGFRILDVSDPERPVEVGWFDTTPYGENPPGFGGGAWTAWPFFESGLVVVSSMNEGLFILRPQRPIT